MEDTDKSDLTCRPSGCEPAIYCFSRSGTPFSCRPSESLDLSGEYKRGKKIGVTSNSRKAIHNLLGKVESVAAEKGVNFHGIKKASGGNAETVFDGQFIRSETKTENMCLGADLFAGTAWTFASPHFANEDNEPHLDYLFIDEAGQVTANVVAMATATRNIILVGDQMQLGQPIQGTHPGEVERKQYYDQLESQQRATPDITEWLSWFLDWLGRAISNAERTFGNVLFKAQLWDMINQKPVNDRQRQIINRMLEDGFEGFINTSKYANLAKCSNDTALRDIRELKDRGIFIQNPSGGRSTSYRLPDSEE